MTIDGLGKVAADEDVFDWDSFLLTCCELFFFFFL